MSEKNRRVGPYVGERVGVCGGGGKETLGVKIFSIIGIYHRVL